QSRFNFRISLSKLFLIGFVLFFDDIVEEIQKSKIKGDTYKFCYTEVFKFLIPFIKDEFVYFIKINEKIKKYT
ncbi:MAG: hypothetical protein JW982_04520, partial [Spirochaetes bacterium]|nr:hypothetical protein [Spirochaetota bacterium]